MFARQPAPGPTVVHGHPEMGLPSNGLAPQPRVVMSSMPPRQRGHPSPTRPLPPQHQHQNYPPGPTYAPSPSPHLQYMSPHPGPPPPSGPQSNLARIGSAAGPSQQQQQYSVEQAISQSLPPGIVTRPYPPPPPASQFARNPPPPPPPPQHMQHRQPPPTTSFRPPPPPAQQPRQYDSPPQYPDVPRSAMNGPPAMMDSRAGVGQGGPSSEYRLGPDNGAGGALPGGQSVRERYPQAYEPGRRVPPPQGPSADPEPSHRVLFHSYILDYLQKQGFHATASAFLLDAPDTNVRRPATAEPSSNKGKGRATYADDDKPSSDHDNTSPIPPRGDDANSPSGGAPANADSIGSTDSSLSNFGFGAAPSNGTSPSQSSPESVHVTLQQPQALIHIETPQGFLFEWWTVFWDVFRAKSGKGGSYSAKSFIEVSNSTYETMVQRRRTFCFEEPLSVAEQQHINPAANPYSTSPPQGQGRRPPDPNVPALYPAQRRPSLAPQPPPNMAQRPPPSLPVQMTPAQASQHQQNQIRYQESLRPPPSSGPPPPPNMSGPPPPPAGVSRQLMLNRRGAISPAPIPLAQGPEQASIARQRQHQAQLQQQNAQQHAMQSAQQQHAMQAQHQAQQHQIYQQQQQHHANLQAQAAHQAQQAQIQAQMQAESQARYNSMYQHQEAARAQSTQAAQQAMAQGRFARPTSAIGTPGGPPRQSSQAGSPYPVPPQAGSPYAAPQHGEVPSSPNKTYSQVPNGLTDPNRPKHPPSGYGTPQADFSPQPSMGQQQGSIDAYRAQLGANQSHALAAIQQASPRNDGSSPYPTDRPTPVATGLVQGGPSPYSNYPGDPEYLNAGSSPAFIGAPGGGQQPHGDPIGRPQSSADGAFREQKQDGSMPPPPPSGQLNRRTLSQQQVGGGTVSNAPTPQGAAVQTPSASQYESPGSVAPQTPSATAATAAAGKRKRETTKDVREPPKKRATKGRERSESVASIPQPPTPSPVAAAAGPVSEYAQSPASYVSPQALELNGPGMGELNGPGMGQLNDMPSQPDITLTPSASGGEFQPDDIHGLYIPDGMGDMSFGPGSGIAGPYDDPLGFDFMNEFMTFPDTATTEVEELPQAIVF